VTAELLVEYKTALIIIKLIEFLQSNSAGGMGRNGHRGLNRTSLRVDLLELGVAKLATSRS